MMAELIATLQIVDDDRVCDGCGACCMGMALPPMDAYDPEDERGT